MEEIRRRCLVPAISVGAIHEGRLILDEHAGFYKLLGDSESDKPDIDTVFPICSLSKTFVTAAFCLLVKELDDLSWTDSIKKHLPNYCPKDDPTVSEATFDEVLRHSAGIDNPIVPWLGPNGQPLVARSEFIDLLNDTPTQRLGKSLRNTVLYSNVAYGLVVLVIEKLSKTTFADYVQRRFLQPLNMHNTAVFVSQVDALDQQNKLAHSYVKLSGNRWKSQVHSWTDENHGPLLGMIGMRSSVRDMLTLFSALMEAYSATASEESKSRMGAHEWSQAPFEPLAKVETNPFKGVQAMFDGAYWWLPCECNGGEEHKFFYHVPWIRVSMPCSKLSWSSYNVTPNPDHNEDVFGASLQANKLAYHFNGVCIFGTAAVKFFPETRSAVVAFASGLNVGDAAEFASLLLTQWLFDLEPKKDILDMVDQEIVRRLENFNTIYKDLDKHKGELAANTELSDFVGEYTGLGATIRISMTPDLSALELSLQGNGNKVNLPLEPYGTNQFSFWPKDRDEWLEGGWLDWDHYEVGLIKFQRSSDSGEVDAASWVWEDGANPAVFCKQKQGGSKENGEAKSRQKDIIGPDAPKASEGFDMGRNPRGTNMVEKSGDSEIKIPTSEEERHKPGPGPPSDQEECKQSWILRCVVM